MDKTLYVGCVLSAVFLAGCNRQDTDALSRIGKKVQARTEAVTGDVKSGAAASWYAVSDVGVAMRVTARLRWDKELDGAAIEVAHVGTGVELRGTVRNADQRRRAVMLAESTTAVDGVKDSLVEVDR